MQQNLSIVILLLASVILSSCSTAKYYQIKEVKSDKVKQNKQGKFSYSKDSLTIHYFLWKEGGKLSFVIENHANKILAIQLKESFYEVNGWTYPYYENETYSSSSKKEIDGLSPNNVRISKSKKEGVSKKEKEIKVVTPGSKKYFGPINLNQSVYTDCNLTLAPDKSDSAEMSFNKSNSPMRLKNILKYKWNEKSESFKKISNQFWVGEIFNINKDEFIKVINPEVCKNKFDPGEKRNYIQYSPNRLYVSYEAKNNKPSLFLSALGFLGGLGIIALIS